MNTKLTAGLAAALSMALFVGGCGGGSDGDAAPATSQVPGSASESSAGFMSYLTQLVVASADGLEPVDVSGVNPPVSDTAEPDPLS